MHVLKNSGILHSFVIKTDLFLDINFFYNVKTNNIFMWKKSHERNSFKILISYVHGLLTLKLSGVNIFKD